MGLNLPMLLASNNPTMDTWANNPVAQFSSPPPATATTTNSQLPAMSAFNTNANLHELSVSSRSLFGSSSNNSEPNASPVHKPMDLAETVEDAGDKSEDMQQTARAHSPAAEFNNVAQATELCVAVSEAADAQLPLVTTSPIPNCVNTNEAHTHNPPTAAIPITTPTRHPHHLAHPHYTTPTTRQYQPHLDIKQELVDYFNPHTASAASAEEFAQDLRVAAAARTLNFGTFVLPRNLRPPRGVSPSESIEEKFSPLNMRKLNAQHSSYESISEETNNTPTTSGRLQLVEAPDTAAAATIYAESLTNRDDCDYVGSNVTIKLRALDRTQRIIAEKLISEVLFYGQFGELERTARIQPK